MKIPVGSKQRSVWLTPPQLLLERVAKDDSEDPELDRLYEEATRYTIERFETAGSPVVRDGEQRRYHNFATYCVHGPPKMAPCGFEILVSDGYTRHFVRLTCSLFGYIRYAECNLDVAMRYAAEPCLIQLQQKS
jgi:5-methyltetrahydropteroyltriglutamate--homocysteine methyltransferase